MNTISKAFYQAVQKGLDAAKAIPVTEQKDKALAYAELANAIALTGLVEDGVLETTDAAPAEKEVKKTETKKTATTTKKDSLKADSGKGAATTAPIKEEKEETVPEQTEEVTSTTETDVEVTDEWTEEMTEAKAEALERLKQYTDAWTEDYVYNQCVPAFFEDPSIVGGDNIRPTNIDGFITYLDQIANSAE